MTVHEKAQKGQKGHQLGILKTINQCKKNFTCEKTHFFFKYIAIHTIYIIDNLSVVMDIIIS